MTAVIGPTPHNITIILSNYCLKDILQADTMFPRLWKRPSHVRPVFGGDPSPGPQAHEQTHLSLFPRPHPYPETLTCHKYTFHISMSNLVSSLRTHTCTDAISARGLCFPVSHRMRSTAQQQACPTYSSVDSTRIDHHAHLSY
jgi:hypothetical protein